MVIVDDDDLVQAIFDGLPSSRETFLSSVSGREIQPTFERLWHECLEDFLGPIKLPTSTCGSFE